MRSISEVLVVEQEDADAENLQPANNISPGEKHGTQDFHVKAGNTCMHDLISHSFRL